MKVKVLVEIELEVKGCGECSHIEDQMFCATEDVIDSLLGIVGVQRYSVIEYHIQEMFIVKELHE